MIPQGTFDNLAASLKLELYDGIDFTGTLKTKATPRVSSGLTDFNDMTSSIRVASGVRALLCRHSCPGNFENSFEVVGPYNINDLDKMNNAISNFVTYNYNETDLTARV